MAGERSPFEHPAAQVYLDACNRLGQLAREGRNYELPLALSNAVEAFYPNEIRALNDAMGIGTARPAPSSTET